MWVVLKPRGLAGLAFLRALLADAVGEIRELHVRTVGRRLNIYAVRIEPTNDIEKKLIEQGVYFKGSGYYELLLSAESLRLGDGWERIEIVKKRMRHREYGVVWEFDYLRYRGKEIPVGRVPEYYEPVEGS